MAISPRGGLLLRCQAQRTERHGLAYEIRLLGRSLSGRDQPPSRSTPSTLGEMAAQLTELPPRGYYLAHEVGRLVGVSGDRIGQWARRGYIRPSVQKGRPNVYAYQDVAEAMVVHELVLRKVRLSIIKKAIEQAREQSGSNWPLSHARMLVPLDGSTVVLDDGSHKHDVRNRRGVLDLDLEPIQSMLRRGGWAARDIPDLHHIEVDPDRLSGRPVIRNTRVPAEDAGRLAEQEDGLRILREDYGLTEEQIRDAQRWWRTVERYEAA